MDRKGKCVAQNVKDRAGQLAALFVSNFGNQSSETPWCSSTATPEMRKWDEETTASKEMMSRNATPATEFSLCHYFARRWQCDSQKTQHDTSKVLRLPRKMTSEVFKVLRLPRKMQHSATHRLKTSQKYRACHTKRLVTRLETCCNVTKCHACHAKWSYATLETSKRFQKWPLLQNLP